MTGDRRGESFGELNSPKLEGLPVRFEERGILKVNVTPVAELVEMIKSGSLELNEFKDNERYGELAELVADGLVTVFDAVLKLAALRAAAIHDYDDESRNDDPVRELVILIERKLKPLGIGSNAIDYVGEAIGEAMATIGIHETFVEARGKREDAVRADFLESDPMIDDYNDAMRELNRLVEEKQGRWDIRVTEELESIKSDLLAWDPLTGVSPLWPDIQFVDRSLPENAKAPLKRLLIEKDPTRSGLVMLLQNGTPTKRAVEWKTEREAFLPSEVRNKNVVENDAALINAARAELLKALQGGGVVEITTVEQLSSLRTALRTIGKDNTVQDPLHKYDGELANGNLKIDVKLSGSGDEIDIILKDADGSLNDAVSLPAVEKFRAF